MFFYDRFGALDFFVFFFCLFISFFLFCNREYPGLQAFGQCDFFYIFSKATV